MNILNYDSAQKRRSGLINLRDVISFKKIWDTAQKEIDDSEDWNSRHGMKVLHYILNAFSVHNKGLCRKLEFTWEKKVLDALLSAAVKKTNMTVGFISQGISSKYINSIYTNIFKCPHPRPKPVLLAHIQKRSAIRTPRWWRAYCKKKNKGGRLYL